MLESSETELFSYVKENYGIDLVDFTDEEKKAVHEFLGHLSTIKGHKDRLKYLCEQSDRPEFSALLDSVPYKRFKEYVVKLGVEVCRSVGYKIEELNKKLSIRSFDKNLLKEKIYETFKVGNSYTRSGIKEILAGIYKEIGYKATAKASDLDNYFEYKKGLVTVNNKRASSFKLINKK